MTANERKALEYVEARSVPATRSGVSERAVRKRHGDRVVDDCMSSGWLILSGGLLYPALEGDAALESRRRRS